MTSHTPAIKDLKGLKAVKREIDARLLVQAALKAQALAAAAKAKAESAFFAHTIGTVRTLPAKHRPGQQAQLVRVPVAPIPVQRQRDEQAVMREAISDGLDADTLIDSDAALSFCRPGMGPDILRKLRRGVWSIQRQLDLHGLRREDARDALSVFIRQAQQAGLRCVRVVHGKGLGSPGKTPVLKSRVQGWLMQKQEVLAFVQARPVDGGAGALLVLLAQR